MTFNRRLIALFLGLFCLPLCGIGCRGGGASRTDTGTGGAAGAMEGGPVGVAGAGGTAGTGGAAGSTGGGGDGAGAGTIYACVGGLVLAEDGEVRSAGPGKEPVTCVVGQSYCSARSNLHAVGVLPTLSCVDLTGPLAACAVAPTCACICAHGVWCKTECSCSDTDGFAIVSCEAI